MTYILLSTSCQKDEQFAPDKLNNELSEPKMLKFDNIDHYNASLKEVLAMSSGELRIWEESHNFKSLGRSAEEFYQNIDPESFKTIGELKDFVKSNSNFLMLIKDETGEYTLETTLYNIPERYFINRNKMYQIDDKVYKIVGTTVIATNIENIDELKLVNDKDELSIKTSKKNACC